MKNIAIATFAPLHHQLPLQKQQYDVILKAYKKTGYVDSCYLLNLWYNLHKKLLTFIAVLLLKITSSNFQKMFIKARSFLLSKYIYFDFYTPKDASSIHCPNTFQTNKAWTSISRLTLGHHCCAKNQTENGTWKVCNFLVILLFICLPAMNQF